jgi:long-chain acyl-CoA synthetase
VIEGARILLTGATGMLGHCLARELVRGGAELTLVVRASSPEEARERARVALGDAPLDRVTTICGDVTKAGLGVRRREQAMLRSIDVVVHSAATTSFSKPVEVARTINVEATRRVLDLACATAVSKVVHVSTAFVAGKRTGRILESELEHCCGFQNGYQESKYEAELLVQRYRSALPLVVLRPSIVLDTVDLEEGQQSAFRFAIELIRSGILPALPGTRTTPVDLITDVDAARALTRLVESSAPGATYHVAGGDRAPTLEQVVAPIRAIDYLEADRFAWQVAKWKRQRPTLASLYDRLDTFLYELAHPKIFDTTRAEAALGAPATTTSALVFLHDATTEPRVPVGAFAP